MFQLHYLKRLSVQETGIPIKKYKENNVQIDIQYSNKYFIPVCNHLGMYIYIYIYLLFGLRDC